MSQSQKTFKIRLSVKGDITKKLKIKQTNHVVTITPSMTMDNLIQTSFEMFDVPKTSHAVELYSGFPLKLLQIPDGGGKGNSNGNGSGMADDNNGDTGNGTQHLVESFIRGGENVVVKFISTNTGRSSTKTSKASKKRPLSASESSTSTTSIATTNKRGRPKRAAAAAASASFKDVIQEQDTFLKKEQQRSTRSSSNAQRTKSSITNNNNNNANNNASKKAAAAARAVAANSRRLASLPGGRRLNDDSTTHMSTTNDHKASKTTKRGKKSVPGIFQGMKSEDDISFALLSSVGNGNGKKVSKVLRSAMKRTIEKSYEVSRAVVRCSAITSGDVTFIQNGDNNENDKHNILVEGTCNEIGTYTIKYPKGIEGVGYYEDQHIHIISIETLKAVIQSVYTADQQQQEDDGNNTAIDTNTAGDGDHDDNGGGGKEMLKPNNMAQLSPRVFWSLWFHFKDKCQSIEKSLELLLPELSWTFLVRRSRQLSQKAKDNLRQNLQQQQQTGTNQKENQSSVKETDDEYDASVKAIKSVEEAMEKMYESNNVESLRARAEQAALDRITRNENNVIPKWDLVTPTELDIDELRECIVEAMEAEEKNLLSEQIDTCAQYLISNCSIQNWRMLANANIDDLYPNISQSSSMIIPDIDIPFVSAMITAAQQRSMEEIVLEIVDGNEDIYHILREDASSATPQDMTLWRLVPSALLEEAPALISDELKVTEQRIVNWCEKSQIAMDTLQWLRHFSTSIS